jgi:hypothetical protein
VRKKLFRWDFFISSQILFSKTISNRNLGENDLIFGFRKLAATPSYDTSYTKTLGVTTTTLSFDAALDYCKSNGAYLASITSAFENAFIQSSNFFHTQ